MTKNIAMILCATALIMSAGEYAHAGLKQLMELGDNQARIAKALNKETDNYEKVKKAIDSGELEEGITAEKIRKKYGDPIFDNVYDEKRGAYKWLYMPASSDHFKGDKVYLFLDEDSVLVGWKALEEL